MTLVELMISITIGLLLLAGVTLLISHQSSASSELDKASRQIENGRYAVQTLQSDIELAGYYGEFSNLAAPPGALPDPCATAVADLQAAMPLHVQAYDSPASVPAPLSACLPDASHVPGTDILVIRHVDTTSIAPAAASPGQVYLQSTQAAVVLGTGSDTSVFTLKKKDGTTPADLRKFLVTIYYLSPCSTPSAADGSCTAADDGGTPVPTLKRRQLSTSGSGGSAAAAFTETALVEGIENLQFDFGVDTSGDGAPDTYNKAPAVTDWSNVMTVRINLLARNTELTGGHKDKKEYNLGEEGKVGPFNDAYKRHAFSQLVRFVNPSGRREK